MDLLSYIIEKHTNNIITRDSIMWEVSREGYDINQNDMDDAFFRLLNTLGAYHITNQAISLVYKPPFRQSVPNEYIATAKFLQSRLPNTPFDILDIEAFSRFFPKPLKYKCIIVEIEKANIDDVYKVLHENNFDVHYERRKISAESKFITTTPILLKAKSKVQKSNGIPVNTSAEYTLAYILENPFLFNLSQRIELIEFIKSTTRTMKINYDEVLSSIAYRKRSKIKHILSYTPEYAFLLRRIQHFKALK